MQYEIKPSQCHGDLPTPEDDMEGFVYLNLEINRNGEHEGTLSGWFRKDTAQLVESLLTTINVVR